MDEPGANAKIPFVPDSVGPIEEELQRSVDSDFIEAPTATTFLPFAGSSNWPPLFPGAIKARDQGISKAHASKSPVRAVYSVVASPQELECKVAPFNPASTSKASTSGGTHPASETISWNRIWEAYESEEPF